MGTNYYYHEKPPCECCDRPFKALHIGKSSAGWCFSLHVIPEEGINSLDDWRRKWLVGGVILDEYGGKVSPEEMLAVITKRERQEQWDKAPFMYDSWDSFHAINGSQKGPGGLVRHAIGRYCVGHGEGTWDLIPGEFS